MLLASKELYGSNLPWGRHDDRFENNSPLQAIPELVYQEYFRWQNQTMLVSVLYADYTVGEAIEVIFGR